MTKKPLSKSLILVSLCISVLSACSSEEKSDDTAASSKSELPSRPEFVPDGTVRVPPFELPPSPFLSEAALKQQQQRAAMPDRSGMEAMDMDIEQRRAGLEAGLAPQVAAMVKAYPVDVTEQSFADVPTRIITPKDKKYDKSRVLINLHGGAFSLCAGACAMLESAPIASLGGYKVITVDYRMAPEHQHPAAVEDVAKVYQALLEDYEPEHIGIYGCSAGGALTAQTAAWLAAHDLPQAGAVGIFGAGAVRFGAGDSAYITGYIDGSFPPPPKPGEKQTDLTRGYFAGVDMRDPIVSPALHPDVIAQFPPTLVITGTRAMDMSPAIVTNSALLKARVPSTLVVGEGMGHCYIYSSQLPESQDAYQIIVDFFRKHLR